MSVVARERGVHRATGARGVETLASLVQRLGSVPLDRIAAHPAPGTATEADVFTRPGGEKRLYELVDGTLVEKAMGYFEARLAYVLGWFLENFLQDHDLGFGLPADATIRLTPGLVRLPDLSFISWDHFPSRELPDGPFLNVGPDLAVEVISKSNTKKEMQRKLDEYFEAGARLVWYAYPDTQTVRVHTGRTEFKELGIDDTLDGGDVLPGFELKIRDWFERAGKREG